MPKYLYRSLLVFSCLFNAVPSLLQAAEQGSLAHPMTQFLPSPPKPSSTIQERDNKVFLETRRLKDTTRWVVARHDVQMTVSKMLENFSCAANLSFSFQKMPAVYNLMFYIKDQIITKAAESELYWKRSRPTNLYPGQPVCNETDRVRLAKTYSYPSLHTTQSWGIALVLAQLIPEHASAILQRGRQYGESRIICGFHWLSDVEAGFIEGAGLIAILQSDPEFTRKLHKAQTELQGIYKSKHDTPPPPFCQAEHDALQDFDLHTPTP